MVDNIFGRRIADVLQALIAAGIIGGGVYIRELASVQSEVAVRTAVMSAQIKGLQDQYALITERITIGGFNADQGRALTFRVEKIEETLKDHMALGSHSETDKRLTVIENKLDLHR